MKHIAIIGLGLMGGSLGLALKGKGYRGRVTGYTRSPERRATALNRGAVDAVFDEPGKAVAGADVVVYCAPILIIPGLVRETLPFLKPRCTATDVGSTKAQLVKDIGVLTKGTQTVFVGSHPIAGSEQQGIDAARAGLYEGSTVVITPVADTPAVVVAQVESLWRSVGAVVHRMAPEEHDRTMALTSHLPHLAASLLAATVGRGGGDKRLAAFCGPGFRDTTRVAEGPPEIWDDILKTNHEQVLVELKAFGRELQDLVAVLERGDFAAVTTFLEKSRAARRALAGGREAF
ncbi:MAG: prephenate dehydrogenase/arogenate dehydrogenase family protein [bacterium]